MLKAVLIDLDNTMVLFDEPEFYKRFFPAVADFFDGLCPRESLRDRLVNATMSLRMNPEKRNNKEIFLERFIGDAPLDPKAVWERFVAFYQTAYPSIQVATDTPQGLHETLDALGGTGLELVVATNPIFPPSAPLTRMGWAGIDPGMFHLITHLENMAAVKPRGSYYRQIAERMGVAPEECFMVGNDPVNDMAAAGVGMGTYLTSDAADLNYASATATSGAKDAPISKPDFRGPFSGILAAIEERVAQGNGSFFMVR